MATANTDRNVLFGILALKVELIGQDDLVRAMRDWVQRKSTPLGRILVEQRALATDDYKLVEALVQRHLQLHGEDPARSLAAVHSFGSVGEVLEQVNDADIKASLAQILAIRAPEVDFAQTLATRGGTSAEKDLYGTRDPAEALASGSRAKDNEVLAHGANTADFSGGGDASAAQPSAGFERSGVGLRFRILRPHARGGLGEVFLAQDEELKREVALKEIRGWHADHPDLRARFLQEAEITGRLEHPSIVPVYGLGTYADGRPFYAMRFIQGNSLLEAIAHFHGPGLGSDSGERGLELRRLLGQFLDVCNALSYAHSRGVLHRDLKPGNIMLGPYGETLVVDWGLAKTMGSHESGGSTAHSGPVILGTGSATPTRMGDALGTPQFMSPEQAAGQVDQLGPASDIYSLGATLYSLLTGKPPFGDKELGTLLQKVMRGEFLPPRQVAPQVPAALDAICLKAMAREPEARYPTVRALADDIEHWLADEPVAVYREPLTARVARWSRRHRTVVTGTAVLLVTAVLASTVGTVLIAREQARTAEQRRLAEANFQTALRAINDMLTEVAQEQLATEPGMERKRKALLAGARKYYQQFLEQQANDRDLRKETALAHARLADISRFLGEPDQAKEAYGQAIAMLTRLAEEHPADATYRRALADSYNFLGETWRVISKPAEARDAYRKALELQEQLAIGAPDRADYRMDMARSYYNLGILFKDTRQPREAETAFDESIALLSRLVADHAQNPAYRQHLARVYLNVGPVLRASGRPEKAEEAYGRAIRLQTNLVDEDPLTPDYRYELGVSYNNLGYLFVSLGRNAPAEDAFRHALERFARLALDFPSVPVYRKELANTQNNLAIALARFGRLAAAEEAWGHALELFAKLAAEYPDVTDYVGHQGLALGNLGWLLLRQQDRAELAVSAMAVGAGPLAAAAILIADRAERLDRLARARQRLDRAIVLVRAALKPNTENPTYLQALRDQSEYLAEALVRQGSHAEAAKVARELPTIFRTQGQDYILAAGILAQCAQLAANDPTLLEDRRGISSAAYGDQAVELLSQGIVHGYKDGNRLTQPPFTALGQREDFRKLLAKLKTLPPAPNP